MTRTVLRGVGITQRKVEAPLFFYPGDRSSDDTDPVRPHGTVEEERARLRLAMREVAEDLSLLEGRASREAGAEEAQIFAIHAMLLEDEDLQEALEERISAGATAEEALSTGIDGFVAALEALSDDYLSARTNDLLDLAAQIRRRLSGSASSLTPPPSHPYILVARDLTPSETIRMDKSLVVGFVTLQGSAGSHTAILARAMNIPALVGVEALDASYDGQPALLDAKEGCLILGADEQERRRFQEIRNAEDRIAREHDAYLRSLIHQPAVTRGGHKMMIYANIGSPDEVSAALEEGAEGIGLLRSEFLYLRENDYPSEELLFSSYRDIAERMQGKRTVIRTLDIGADKQIPYFNLPKEENPALGCRAIRLCLHREELFRTQLRAILRASAYGRVALMLPMIVSVEEVLHTRRLIEDCKRELKSEGHPFDAHPECGIMIETPAAALMSRELAHEVDFFSVGTNDLLQYTLAADRQNPQLYPLLEKNREPMLRLCAMASEAIHQTGGWIGICGELAADLQLTQRFADLRIDELSVAPPYLLGVRERVRDCL